MTFRFNTDDLVVNMIHGDSMTLGRVYRVVNSYDGHSGCGAQEWCRVADDRGVVSGYDPDRFIPYEPSMVETLLPTALRMRRRLTEMLKGVPKDGVMASLHGKLRDLLEDAEAVVAASAKLPDDDQIILNQIEGHDRHGTFYEVRVGTKPVWYYLCHHRATAGEPCYFVFFGEHTLPIKATQFDVALAEVKFMLKAQAAGRPLAEWAAEQTLPVMDDVRPPVAS